MNTGLILIALPVIVVLLAAAAAALAYRAGYEHAQTDARARHALRSLEQARAARAAAWAGP